MSKTPINTSIVTPSATSTLSNDVITNSIQQTSNAFASDSGQGFSKLPVPVQAAIIDYAYNYGTNGAFGASVAAAIKSSNWQALATALLTSGNKRWAADGQAIQNAINNHTLPASGTICH